MREREKKSGERVLQLMQTAQRWWGSLVTICMFLPVITFLWSCFTVEAFSSLMSSHHHAYCARLFSLSLSCFLFLSLFRCGFRSCGSPKREEERRRRRWVVNCFLLCVGYDVCVASTSGQLVPFKGMVCESALHFGLCLGRRNGKYPLGFVKRVV